MTASLRPEHAGDAAAIVALFMTWAGYLSTIAAIVASIAAAVWYCVQIHDSQWYKDWTARRHKPEL